MRAKWSSTKTRWPMASLCLWFALGCGGGDDADAGSRLDAGRGADASTGEDAGAMDGSAMDASAMDAGASDGSAGGSDASATDGGSGGDAGVPDGSDGPDGSATDGGVGFDAALTPTPRAGELVIVEVQGNPQIATDEQAEYIEVLNVTGRTLNLQGVRIAHVDFAGTGAGGGEPTASTSTHAIDEPVMVPGGERVLLTRSSGGYFGGASIDHVYGSFVLSNGGARANRLRLLVPSWDGTEPPAPADVLDEVITEVGAFDNPLRGRALQLDPARVPNPTAESNDDPASWCHTPADESLEYRTSNWGTPRADNDCL